MNWLEKREEILNEIADSNLISDTAKHAVKDLRIENNNKQIELEKKDNKIDDLNRLICTILKNKIGERIYWAHPDWRKIETHTISDIRYEVYESDFFDTKEVKYKGQKLVIIEVDNVGTYLAVDIGRTLFFNEEEAKSHARK